MTVNGRTGIFPHKIDATTDANASVDYEHKEVHSGSCFYSTYTVSLDSADLFSLRFQTPNSSIWAHLQWVIEAQANILIELRETITNVFSPEVDYRFNRNRNYADDSGSVIYDRAGAAATGGTVIWSWSSGGATATPSAGKSPGVVRNTGEIVLKRNEKYELRITSTVDSNVASAYVTWYEHANIE